jgi:hypothetical protein
MVMVRVPSVVVVVLVPVAMVVVVVAAAAAAAGAGAQVRGAVRPLPRPDGPVARPMSARAARPGGLARPGPAAWPDPARPGGLRGAVVPARPGVCEGRGRVGGLPYISYPSLG